MAKKVKVLFIITNVGGFYEDAYSFGLGQLMSCVKENGHEFDLRVTNHEFEYQEVLKHIKTWKPDIVGFTSVSSQFMHVKDLAKLIREDGFKGFQVCGGSHTTIHPESILESDDLDCVFAGESEEAFNEFVDRVANDKPWHDIKNISYNKDGKHIKNEKYPLVANLEKYPFPERDIFFKHNTKTKFTGQNEGGFANFWFSRGCPYLCTYCQNQAIAMEYSGDKYGGLVFKARYRSPQNCIDEIKWVRDTYDIKVVLVGDDTFGIDRKWAEEWSKLYKEQVKLPFRMKIRLHLVNHSRMDMLLEAGLEECYTSVEHGNEHIRNTLFKRNMKRETIVNAFQFFHENNIPANTNYIIGSPAETESTLQDCLDLNREIQPKNCRANIFYPYSGTTLGDYCFKNDLVDMEKFGNFSEERKGSVLKWDDPSFPDTLVEFSQSFRIRSKPYGDIKNYMLQSFPSISKGLIAAKNSFSSPEHDVTLMTEGGAQTFKSAAEKEYEKWGL